MLELYHLFLIDLLAMKLKYKNIGIKMLISNMICTFRNTFIYLRSRLSTEVFVINESD